LGEAGLMLLPDQAKILAKVLSKENPIISIPDSEKMQKIEEYLMRIQ